MNDAELATLRDDLAAQAMHATDHDAVDAVAALVTASYAILSDLMGHFHAAATMREMVETAAKKVVN